MSTVVFSIISPLSLMILKTTDGRKIARHVSKCSYDKEELARWIGEVQNKE